MAKPKTKPHFTPPTIDQLLVQATAHQTAHRYKDLVEVYKELLKREVRPEWQIALGQAYGQRARALAAKGMYREAVAMWESTSASEATELNLAVVVGWMLAAGMYPRAATLLQKVSILPENLQVRLGAILLMGSNELASNLPEDSPLIRHLGSARSALEAWCRGEDAVVREQLRAIPFRSPYRDLRQLLQGLLAADPDLLEAIPPTSPYVGLAQAALAAQAPLNDLERRIATLRPIEQELAATLRGVNLGQLRQVLEVRAATTSAKESLIPLFRWVTTQPAPVPEDQARRFALAILPHQPGLATPFQRRFGSLSPFEGARLSALLAEQEDDFRKAQQYWDCAFHTCDREEPTGTLMAALILRHQAKMQIQIHGPDEAEVTEYLNRSLKLDPLDRVTWLEMIKIQRSDSNPKWGSSAEQALVHLPEDSELLLLAAQGASERKAYKKAIGYANTLFRLDPINSGARRLLINLHLGHVRKSLKGYNIAVAGRGLEAARKFVYDDADGTRVAVHYALLALAQEDEVSARKFAVQAKVGPAGGIGVMLLLKVEGQQTGIKQNHLNSLAEGLAESTPMATQIVALLELAEELLLAHPEQIVFSAFSKSMIASLRAAAAHVYTEKQLVRLLDILHKSHQWDAIAEYAVAALEHFPEHPLFVFYQYLGYTHGQRNRLLNKDRTHLEKAREIAIEKEDIRTAQMIDKFLEMFPMPFQWRFPDRMPSGFPQHRGREVDRVLGEIAEEAGSSPDELRGMLEEFIEAMRGGEEKHEPTRRRRGGKNK